MFRERSAEKGVYVKRFLIQGFSLPSCRLFSDLLEMSLLFIVMEFSPLKVRLRRRAEFSLSLLLPVFENIREKPSLRL